MDIVLIEPLEHLVSDALPVERFERRFRHDKNPIAQDDRFGLVHQLPHGSHSVLGRGKLNLGKSHWGRNYFASPRWSIPDCDQRAGNRVVLASHVPYRRSQVTEGIARNEGDRNPAKK